MTKATITPGPAEKVAVEWIEGARQLLEAIDPESIFGASIVIATGNGHVHRQSMQLLGDGGDILRSALQVAIADIDQNLKDALS